MCSEDAVNRVRGTSVTRQIRAADKWCPICNASCTAIVPLVGPRRGAQGIDKYLAGVTGQVTRAATKRRSSLARSAHSCRFAMKLMAVPGGRVSQSARACLSAVAGEKSCAIAAGTAPAPVRASDRLRGWRKARPEEPGNPIDRVRRAGTRPGPGAADLRPQVSPVTQSHQHHIAHHAQSPGGKASRSGAAWRRGVQVIDSFPSRCQGCSVASRTPSATRTQPVTASSTRRTGDRRSRSPIRATAIA